MINFENDIRKVISNSDYRIELYRKDVCVGVISNIIRFCEHIDQSGGEYYLDLNGITIWFDRYELKSL